MDTLEDARIAQSDAQLDAERIRDEFQEWSEDTARAADTLNDIVRVLEDEDAASADIREARAELDRISLSGPQSMESLAQDMVQLGDEMMNVEYAIDNADDEGDED